MKSTIADRFYDIVVSPPSEVIDNLTSNSPTASLSARQGKVLKDLIENSNSSGTVNYDIMAGASPVQTKSYRRYQGNPYYNSPTSMDAAKCVCSSNSAVYTFEEPVNSSSYNPYIHKESIYIRCIKNSLNIVEKWFSFSQLSSGTPISTVPGMNKQIKIFDAAYSPQLNKICIVGSHGYIGVIDCANTGDISLQRSAFTTDLYNRQNNDFIQFTKNFYEVPTVQFTNINHVFHSHCFKFINITWIPSKNKFYAMSPTPFTDQHGQYIYKTAIMSSSDGINWQKVTSFSGTIYSWCYAEDFNKFYAIDVYRYPHATSPSPPTGTVTDVDCKLMMSTNDCASWTEVPISGKPDINSLWYFYLGGIAYSKTKKTCILFGNLNYRKTEQHDYETYNEYIPFFIKSINNGPFQIDTNLKCGIQTDYTYGNYASFINNNKIVVWIPEIDAFVSTSIINHSIIISKDGIKWYTYNLPSDNVAFNRAGSGSGSYAHPVTFGAINYLKYTNEIYLTSFYHINMDKSITLSA